MAKKLAKLVYGITLSESEYEGFNDQTQAEEFVKLAQKGIAQAYLKATKLPKDKRPDTLNVCSAEIVAQAEGMEEGFLMGEIGGIYKLGKGRTKKGDSTGNSTDSANPPASSPENEGGTGQEGGVNEGSTTTNTPGKMRVPGSK